MAKRRVKIIKQGRPQRKTITRPARRALPRIEQHIASATNGKSLTLEDRAVNSLINDPRFTSVIPCLQNGKSEMLKIGKRCGRCNAKRAKAKSQIMRQVRSCIARMGKPQKQALKQLLGVEEVKVFVASRTAVRNVTF